MRWVLRGVFAALLLLQAASPATAAQELRLASDRWPPFTNTPDEVRLALDLVHEALGRAGFAAETSILEWKSVIPALEIGTFDGSAAIWHTPEREEFLLYSEPYLENRLVLVGRKGSNVSAPSLEELAGKRVALVARYAYGKGIKDVTGPIFVDGRNDQENLQKLLAGEVDYLLADALLVQYLLEYQQEEAAEYLEIGSTPLTRRTLHLAVRRELPEAEDIIAGFNAEIRKMLAEGSYNEILQLDWIRADVDGDGRLELVPRGSKAGTVAPDSGYSIVLPEASDGLIQVSDRFCVGGRLYDDWASVPPEFKVPAGSALDIGAPKPAAFTFRFKF